MDKSTLSNYGWVVIVTLVLAVMLALATPFGSYVAKGASNVIKTFVNTSDDAIDEDNIDTMSKDWDKYLNDSDKYHNDVVPEGGTYTDVNGNEYTEGDSFPEVSTGDTYTYGTYTYTTIKIDEELGWRVTVTEKAENLIYNSPLHTIANKNTLAMTRTFVGYDNPFTLSDTFEIPPTVTTCAGMFQSADGLTKLPDNFKIPDSVMITGNMFMGCSNLKRLPDKFAMPKKAYLMDFMFKNCTSLENTPAYFINDTTDTLNINHLFYGCSNLKEIPETFNFLQTGNNPSDINSAALFSGCTSLEKLPNNFEIPATFKSVSGMFSGCTNLGGTIIINCDIPIYQDLNGNDVLPYQYCFLDTTKPITIKGTSPQLTEIAATANNSNVTVG